jgi:hypothetical protein
MNSENEATLGGQCPSVFQDVTEHGKQIEAPMWVKLNAIKCFYDWLYPWLFGR